MAEQKYRAKVYAGDDIYLGIVVADNLTTLKRLASKKINGHYYKAYDTMQVYYHGTNEAFSFHRRNTLTPSNTCRYGVWR